MREAPVAWISGNQREYLRNWSPIDDATGPLGEEGVLTRKHLAPEKSGCRRRQDDYFLFWIF